MSQTSSLQKVIDALGEDDKKLVTARFEDLMKAVDAAKAEVAPLKEELASANERAERAKDREAAHESNMIDRLKLQLSIMADQLNPDLKTTYYCDPDNLIEEMKSKDPAALLRATDRMICACNRQMMELRAGTVTTEEAAPPAPESRKRKAIEEEADPLTRALAETFELE